MRASPSSAAASACHSRRYPQSAGRAATECELNGANLFEVIELITHDYPRDGMAVPERAAGACLPEARGSSRTRSPVSRMPCRDLIRKTLPGQRSLEILGSGEQIRTLTDVDDTAARIVTAPGHQAAINEYFNISALDEQTVVAIARIVWEACGRDPCELEFRGCRASRSKSIVARPCRERRSG